MWSFAEVGQSLQVWSAEATAAIDTVSVTIIWQCRYRMQTETCSLNIAPYKSCSTVLAGSVGFLPAICHRIMSAGSAKRTIPNATDRVWSRMYQLWFTYSDRIYTSIWQRTANSLLNCMGIVLEKPQRSVELTTEDRVRVGGTGLWQRKR